MNIVQYMLAVIFFPDDKSEVGEVNNLRFKIPLLQTWSRN